MSLKYFKKLGVFKNSTGTNKFDGNSAWSYNWYRYLLIHDGVAYINSYCYSGTTSQHVNETLRMLDLDVLNVVNIEAPRGLDDLAAARRWYEREIAELEEQLANPRNRNRQSRLIGIEQARQGLENLKKLEIALAEYKQVKTEQVA